jgi:hypothetical protein
MAQRDTAYGLAAKLSPVHVLVNQAVDSLIRKQLHNPTLFAANYCSPLFE